MYVEEKRHRLLWALCGVMFVVVAFLAIWRFTESSGEEIRREAEHSIRDTIRRSALQCFTVEGVYPESLEYLQENYGLHVNTEDYYVVYEAFADNLPPTVRVARKDG